MKDCGCWLLVSSPSLSSFERVSKRSLLYSSLDLVVVSLELAETLCFKDFTVDGLMAAVEYCEWLENYSRIFGLLALSGLNFCHFLTLNLLPKGEREELGISIYSQHVIHAREN